MQILNPPLLVEFRRAGICEWCRRPFRCPLEAAHIATKGMGGGCQLDIRINLVSLCRHCHASHHAGQRPKVCDLLKTAADREGATVEYIKSELNRLRRLSRKDVPYARASAGDGGVEAHPEYQHEEREGSVRCDPLHPDLPGPVRSRLLPGLEAGQDDADWCPF